LQVASSHVESKCIGRDVAECLRFRDVATFATDDESKLDCNPFREARNVAITTHSEDDNEDDEDEDDAPSWWRSTPAGTSMAPPTRT
jgi:hypothetical protein